MPNSQGPLPLLLLPEPWRFQRLPGECLLDGHVTVVSSSEDGASDAAAELLAGEFRARGLSSASSSASSTSSSSSSSSETASPSSIAVSVTVAPGATPSLRSLPLGAQSEGYEIEVTRSALAIRASTPAGAFYAAQTLSQLLPPPVPPSRRRGGAGAGGGAKPGLNNAPSPSSLSIPCLEVADAPRFAWRGLLLDVARHFFSARFIVDLIKVIASFKLNVLHLHLVDDQGWRLPSSAADDSGRRSGCGVGERREGGETKGAPPPLPSPSPSAAAAVASPPPSSSSFAGSFPLISELGAWRGDSRREALAWRAERRRKRRRRRKEKAEAEKREKGAAAATASEKEQAGEGKEEEEADDDDDDDDDETLGASPSSSEAESSGSSSNSSSSRSSSASDEDGGGGEEREKRERERKKKKSPGRSQRRRRRRAGGRLSREDVSRILAAARECHVSVVPEVDLPGHCGAAIAAYPELACDWGEREGGGGGERGGGERGGETAGGGGGGGGDESLDASQLQQQPLSPASRDRNRSHPVPTAWGVHHHVLCASSARALEFADSLLSATAALFPSSRFVHVGGDEVPHGAWERCRRGCRARAAGMLLPEGGAAEAGIGIGIGIGGEAGSLLLPFRGELLHSWFVARAEAALRGLGRRGVAWCDAFDAETAARRAMAEAGRGSERAAAENTGGAANADAASSPPPPPPPPPLSPSKNSPSSPSSSVVVMCWRGGGAPGARAAAEGRDVVMCPAGRCYLDYRQAASQKAIQNPSKTSSIDSLTFPEEEPGAWYATLTLRDCWEFDPLVIDEAVAVEEGEGEEEERKAAKEEEGAGAGGGCGGCGDGNSDDARAHSEELTPASGGGEGAVAGGGGASRLSLSEMESNAAGGGGRGNGGGDEDVSSRLTAAAVAGGEPPVPLSQRPLAPPPPYGASLAMASSAEDSDDDAATMRTSGAGGGGAVARRAAADEEEEEVAGPAAATAAATASNKKNPPKFHLRRVSLPPSSHARILGGQACLWTEYVPDEATASYMLFPRLLATSESLWSPRLAERRAFSSSSSPSSSAEESKGEENDDDGEGEGGDSDGEEKRATERAWRDFVARARAQGPRLDGAGWTERRKL